jgi:cupin fold WbuC family metalloprotein
VVVDLPQIEFLKTQATRNPRHRARLCAHKDGQDRIHEMLIALSQDVYIRPHKHLSKSESFHIISGSAIVIYFDDAGAIADVIHVGDFESGRAFYFRNDGDRYHTQIITSPFLVFHETTNGPFSRLDTVFAPWSPEETDVQGIRTFLEKLKCRTAFRKESP